MAYASTGLVVQARQQQALFKEALKNKKLKGRLLHNNAMWSDDGPSVLGVAAKVMEGEIIYREAVLNGGSCDAAFAALRDAVELSENLTYDEPWGWMVPVRHALGALLFEQGRVDEATEVYRKDVALYGNVDIAVDHFPRSFKLDNPPARVVCCDLGGARAYRVLISACNPML